MSEKKKHEPEYTLHIFQASNPETNEAVTAFVVQTVREFVSFNYEIPLESTIEGTVIHLKIHGLHVPENLVPGKGHAHGAVLLRRLKGNYDLSVTNVDGMMNRFFLGVTTHAITVRKSSKKPFIVYSQEKTRI